MYAIRSYYAAFYTDITLYLCRTPRRPSTALPQKVRITSYNVCYTKLLRMKEPSRSLHAHYHDEQYGFPLHDDNELFGRLLLEINQAGLSWETILKKEKAFRNAYSNYNIEEVAAYAEADRERLLNDAGIIRNRLKINAAIENAKSILMLQKEYA